jgi:hypothetical protein
MWGAYEDADMMSYTERWGRVDKAALRRALSDPGSAEASDLVRRFVLIGVPDAYVADRLAAWREPVRTGAATVAAG